MRSRRGWLAVHLVLACLWSAGCSGDGDAGTAGDAGPGPVSRVEVVATHDHDEGAFTQGLVFDDDGRLFESTGQYGQSELRELDPNSGGVRRRVALDPALFGEGVAAVGDELVQLTWQEGVALRWRADDFFETGRDDYDGEGWGLTLHEDRLVQSDGTATLTFRDPDSFDELSTIEVTRFGEQVTNLNELESVGGRILANVWHTDEIVVIDPSDGRVTGTIDASSIVPEGLDDPEAVLNGIAHRPGDPDDRLWLTGKRWPVLYEVRVIDG